MFDLFSPIWFLKSDRKLDPLEIESRMSPRQQEQQQLENLDLIARVAVLETNMNRLVGSDGSGGLLARLDQHMEKMQTRAAGIEKKLVLFSFALIALSGISSIRGETVLMIVRALAGIK